MGTSENIIASAKEGTTSTSIPKSPIPKIYDIGSDELRDVTSEDVERWERSIQAQGVFIPMQRAMIVAARKVWNGEITVAQLHEVASPWMRLLELSHSGTP